MNTVRYTFSLSFVFLAAIASSQTITTQSLIQEMTDLSRLSKAPSPSYTSAQASSYDRASEKEGNAAWFANGDYGKYLRKETIKDRTEWVMADLAGPGAVVRIWSANPTGVLRFYFDGEVEPRMTVKTLDLLTGKAQPWGDTFSYMSSRGCNIYFPFAYGKSLKITVEDTDKKANGMYYHVNYRTYQKGTKVETFDPKASLNLPKSLSAAPDPEVKDNPFTVSAPLAKSWAIGSGPGTIKLLKLKIDFPTVAPDAPWDDPKQKHNILRNLELQIDFDGEKCVRVPVADFFQTGTKANAFETMPVSIRGNEFIARWPMPYKTQATIVLVNHGKIPISGSLGVKSEKLPSFNGQMYFHAQWGHDYDGTRPMADMDFVRTRGAGRYVGSVLTIANPVQAWWGEGDEKVFVDGEEFPSTFGTGTEDYFGYAWCWNQTFQRPYHMQPQCDGPANFGYAVNARWHIIDDITFEKSIRFSIEKWHWAKTYTNYSFVGMWYAKPGGKPVADVDADALAFIELSGKSAPKDAIEGETLNFTATGGKAEVQQNIGGASDEKQIWWMDAPVGSKLTVTVRAATAGKYRINMNACMATDYGAHRLAINCVEIGVMDFYSSELTWQTFDLGEFDLKEGVNELTVECLGSNPAANPKRKMFGLDWIQLKPVTKG